MLKGISWSEYAQGIAIVLFFYYLVVLIRFRKKAPEDGAQAAATENNVPVTKRIWGVKEGVFGPHLPEETVPEHNAAVYMREEEQVVEPLPVGDFGALEELAGKIGEIFAAAGRNANPEELFAAARTEIARYPVLHQHPYRTAITNIVTGKAYRECGITVSGEQVDQLWKGM